MNIQEIKKEYNELQKKLSKPELILDKKEYIEISKRFSFLESLIERINDLEKIEKEIQENQKILEKEEDKEIKLLAEEEIKKLTEKKEKIQKEIEEKITEKENNINEVLVEIRAGAGGEEAALFARDLFEMYQKYIQKKNWKMNVLFCNPTDLGGFKEISFEVKGDEIENYLKYESGVHRVQRIPTTEKSGRIHTSTASVVVLPKPKETDVKINPEDIRIDVFRASGPGGQYVNRRESAVRITHIPTGIVVTSQSARTQVANRENAMAVLRARLYDLQKEKEEKELSKEKKEKTGRRMRAEKIRTYNFPQDRITDHRIKKSWGHIEEILQGELDSIIEALRENLKDY